MLYVRDYHDNEQPTSYGFWDHQLGKLVVTYQTPDEFRPEARSSAEKSKNG